MKNLIRIRQADASELSTKCRSLVPEIQLTAKYEARISGKSGENFAAEENSEIIGFAIGYGEGGFFYIYLFGVEPNHRKQGIGQLLLDHVEQWARDTNFDGVAIQSRNKFPDMLRLLVKNKYKIVAFIDRGDHDSSPIRFEKLC